MKIREVMQAPVMVIAEDQTLAMARGLMQWAEVRHLPVIRRKDGRVIGVVSERDLLRASQRAPQAASGLFVREIMSSPAEHIHPNADIADAAADMNTKRLGCLPVIDGGELVGLVTASDLLGVLGQYPADRKRMLPGVQRGTVASIMYPEPIAVHQDDSLIVTASRMVRAGVRHACVVDGEGCAIGIVSDRDVRRAFGSPALALDSDAIPHAARQLRVGQVMSQDPRCVQESDAVVVALSILLRERFGALPVVNGQGRLCGVVSYIDVMRFMGEELGLTSAA